MKHIATASLLALLIVSLIACKKVETPTTTTIPTVAPKLVPAINESLRREGYILEQFIEDHAGESDEYDHFIEQQIARMRTFNKRPVDQQFGVDPDFETTS